MRSAKSILFDADGVTAKFLFERLETHFLSVEERGCKPDARISVLDMRFYRRGIMACPVCEHYGLKFGDMCVGPGIIGWEDGLASQGDD